MWFIIGVLVGWLMMSTVFSLNEENQNNFFEFLLRGPSGVMEYIAGHCLNLFDYIKNKIQK